MAIAIGGRQRARPSIDRNEIEREGRALLWRLREASEAIASEKPR